jgi:uncharacterized protein YlxP (DUF503 family)
MIVGILSLHMQLPGCTSLKEKRSRIKPLLARLHREFNVSTAETGLNDRWQEALVVCALVSNEAAFIGRSLSAVLNFTEEHFPDLYILEHHIQIL